HAVTEKARRNAQGFSLADRTHGAAGANHQCKPVRREASAADVVAGAISQRGKPGHAGELRPPLAILAAKLGHRLIHLLDRTQLRPPARPYPQPPRVAIPLILAPKPRTRTYGRGPHR